MDIHERWIDHKEEYDAEERKQEQAFAEGLPQEEVDNKPLTEDEEWEAALKDWEEKHGERVLC